MKARAILPEILAGLVSHPGVPVMLVTQSADAALLHGKRRGSHIHRRRKRQAIRGFAEKVWGSFARIV